MNFEISSYWCSSFSSLDSYFLSLFSRFIRSMSTVISVLKLNSIFFSMTNLALCYYCLIKSRSSGVK
jgi:hypothetical protein